MYCSFFLLTVVLTAEKPIRRCLKMKYFDFIYSVSQLNSFILTIYESYFDNNLTHQPSIVKYFQTKLLVTIALFCDSLSQHQLLLFVMLTLVFLRLLNPSSQLVKWSLHHFFFFSFFSLFLHVLAAN